MHVRSHVVRQMGIHDMSHDKLQWLKPACSLQADQHAMLPHLLWLMMSSALYSADITMHDVIYKQSIMRLNKAVVIIKCKMTYRHAKDAVFKTAKHIPLCVC